MSNVRQLKRKVVVNEIEVNIPLNVNPELYEAGYKHGMASNTLTDFRASYRMGFREAKLQLKEIRRERGILQMPTKAKVRMTVR